MCVCNNNNTHATFCAHTPGRPRGETLARAGSLIIHHYYQPTATHCHCLLTLQPATSPDNAVTGGPPLCFIFTLFSSLFFFYASCMSVLPPPSLAVPKLSHPLRHYPRHSLALTRHSPQQSLTLTIDAYIQG